MEDDWTFTKIEGETSLRLGFQGENGRWNCYAMVREDKTTNGILFHLSR